MEENSKKMDELKQSHEDSNKELKEELCNKIGDTNKKIEENRRRWKVTTNSLSLIHI